MLKNWIEVLLNLSRSLIQQQSLIDYSICCHWVPLFYNFNLQMLPRLYKSAHFMFCCRGLYQFSTRLGIVQSIKLSMETQNYCISGVFLNFRFNSNSITYIHLSSSNPRKLELEHLEIGKFIYVSDEACGSNYRNVTTS